jgi:hypothetical protein
MPSPGTGRVRARKATRLARPRVGTFRKPVTRGYQALGPSRADSVRPQLRRSGCRRRVSIGLPSLCSIESGHPFVPTCLLAERRAQWRSRMPPPMRRHRRSRRVARCHPLPWRHCTTGCPRPFSLDHWWEVPSLQRRVWCEPDFRGRIPSMTVGDFANARGEFASDPYTPRTRAGAPVREGTTGPDLPRPMPAIA